MIPWERDDGTTPEDDVSSPAWGWAFAAWVALAAVAAVVGVVAVTPR